MSPIMLVVGLAGGSIAISLNMLALVMVGKVNERLPERERISYLWWSRDVLKRYEQIHPGGRLGWLWRAGEIALGLWFASSAACVLLGYLR
jgi:hypothetical protein